MKFSCVSEWCGQKKKKEMLTGLKTVRYNIVTIWDWDMEKNT